LRTLEGKNALVTGASSGFGRAIAAALAGAGANVALIGRDATRLAEVAHEVEAASARAVVCAAELADEAQIEAAIRRATAELGFIEVLVNNAGMNIPQRTIRDTTSAQWRDLLEVNLTAAFVFTKALLPEMMERETGTIINVSSRAALRPHLIGGVGYSTSKMGMDSLTQVTNEEGNPCNVRACLVCPGVGNTPLLDQRPVPPPAEQRKNMLQPEDVAAAVLLAATLPQRVNVNLISLLPTRV
jgi:NADP-dependent 3-hydroxy acid dehydrogenase YdfG